MAPIQSEAWFSKFVGSRIGCSLYGIILEFLRLRLRIDTCAIAIWFRHTIIIIL